tara:strand:+ start:3483 stop:3758 length:276 start_codon:yes stop_codon:yes gene_type:complete
MKNTMNEMVTQVSITNNEPGNNPVFNCLKVAPQDEAAGSFLRITGEDEQNEGASISLDWEEWDALVKVVAKYRQEWEWTVAPTKHVPWGEL